MPQFDPSLFRPEAITPEVREFNRRLTEMMAQAPPTHTQEPAAIRAARREGRGAFGAPVYLEQAQERSVPGADGEVPVRIFVPDQVDAVYLHIHGGGWVLGSADAQDTRLWTIATEANVAVVSVDYRLAPEHCYPAGPDDCESAAVWVLEHAREEFGTDRLLIGGESAGGHLAAATLLRMRDRHGYTGWLGANLVYGVFDVGMTPSQKGAHDAPIIPAATMKWFGDLFCPGEVDRCDPDVSPLYADLREMPRALFSIGTLDPLLDDSLLMWQRWLGAGNDAELAVYPGAVHGFHGFPGHPLGEQSNRDQIEFLRSALAA